MVLIQYRAAVYFTLFNTLYESKIFQVRTPPQSPSTCLLFSIFFFLCLSMMQAIAVAGETISWARSLLGGIDIAIKEYPGSTVAIYFFSMLAGMLIPVYPTFTCIDFHLLLFYSCNVFRSGRRADWSSRDEDMGFFA